MIIVHDPRCAEYGAAGHPERPERVLRSAEYLRATHPAWTWQEPQPASDDAILRAHSPLHLARLSEESDFDADTPAYKNIAAHARRAAGGALHGLRLTLSG